MNLAFGVYGLVAETAVEWTTGNVVQSSPVRHVVVGNLSGVYRVIGPLAVTPTADPTISDNATPLVLIMGFSGTMDLWSPAFVTALAQDKSVIVFDNRGIGETNDPMGEDPFSQLADDTAAFIKALGYEREDVLGWSMGGDIAIDLGVRRRLPHPQGAGGGDGDRPAGRGDGQMGGRVGRPLRNRAQYPAGDGHGLMYQDPEGLARLVLMFLG